MSCTFHTTVKLPKDILLKLENNGAVVLRDCPGMPMYMLGVNEEKEATRMYMEFLGSDREVDPLLVPTFGPPFNNFVSDAVQREIHYLLSTFRPMLKGDILTLGDNFVPGEIPANLIIPPGNAYQYHVQISIQRVQQEIENPTIFAVVCPNLAMIPSGNVICELLIGYANCHVMRRIRKA